MRQVWLDGLTRDFPLAMVPEIETGVDDSAPVVGGLPPIVWANIYGRLHNTHTKLKVTLKYQHTHTKCVTSLIPKPSTMEKDSLTSELFKLLWDFAKLILYRTWVGIQLCLLSIKMGPCFVFIFKMGFCGSYMVVGQRDGDGGRGGGGEKKKGEMKKKEKMEEATEEEMLELFGGSNSAYCLLCYLFTAGRAVQINSMQKRKRLYTSRFWRQIYRCTHIAREHSYLIFVGTPPHYLDL